MNKDRIVEVLIQRGKELFDRPFKKIIFTGNDSADDLLNDLDNFPHAYVLACLMDRQITAKRAWLIPYSVSQEIGSFKFRRLVRLNLEFYRRIFIENNLHRFNNIMSGNFYQAIQVMHIKYHDNASNIWKNSPRSASIVRRFLEFKGAGLKIATMAANILARDFKIPLRDRTYIDISTDRHTKRVFTRLGLTSKNPTNNDVIYCVRELNPEYPGIFDLSLWEIGRKWCRPRNPDCGKCYLNIYCPHQI